MAAPGPDGGDTARDTARSAGRGGLAIAGAKVFFILTGLVQQVALKHVLGLQAYGALGRVQSIASVIYNPVVSTSVQGVSRAVAQAPDAHRAAAARRALGVHAAAIVPIAAAFLLAAPLLGQALHAPHLVLPLRICTGVLLLYGLYTPLVGVLNGTRRFAAQAGLDVLCATLRTVGLLGGAWYFARWGAGVEGALGGFVAAVAVVLLAALRVAGLGERGPGGTTARQHLLFIAPLAGGQLALNLLFQCDLTLLGRFAADAAAYAGLPVAAADTLAGAYRNAQLFCFLPYQLLLAVTFVLFPLLATAQRDGDREAVARYVRAGVRLAVVLAGLMVSVTAGLSGPLLRLVFGRDSAALGADAMLVLALGLGVLAIFGILTTVLTSLQREGQSAALTVAALGMVVGLCFLLARGQPFGPAMLVRTAISTGAGMLAATLLAAACVKRTVGAVVAPHTLLRVGVALGAAIALGRLLPAPGKLMTLPYCAGVAALYLAALAAMRELGRADLDALRTVLPRRH
ncbi:MAG: lipopolysaccharide biosynthesis protein [Deltaproteobacteria bacterium]|nr:lipopolysaccharide biosynthesis protein [Deltaproteobacteria bacterium]